MADLDLGTIFSVLTAANKNAEEDSPYAFLDKFGSDFSTQATNLALSRNKQTGEANYGLGEGLAVALGAGLLGGFTSGLNKSYVAEQNDLARGVLSDALSGRTVTRPERLSSSVFTPIENAASLLNVQRQYQQQDEEKKAARALESAIQLKRFTDPLSSSVSGPVKAEYTPEGLNVVSPTGDSAGASLIRSGLQKAMLGADLTPDEATAMAGAPLDIQGRFAQYRQQQALTERATARLGLSQDQLETKKSEFDIRTGLGVAQHLAASDPAKHFEDTKANWEALNTLADQDTQSAAIGMIKAAAKISNPGAIVRESTFQILSKNPNNFTLQLQDFLSEIQGKGQLSPEHKTQLIEAMKPFVQASSDAYRQHVSTQLETFGNLGGKPGNIQTLPAVDFGTTGTTSGASKAIPAGMKLQRNSKGETRLVPK